MGRSRRFIGAAASRATIAPFAFRLSFWASCPSDPIMTHPEYILTLSCLDQRGIVYRVSGFLADHGCNIVDSAQFGDAQSQLFFMRVHFTAEDAQFDGVALHAAFELVASSLQMTWQLHDAAKKPRVMLMVSKIGHCLNDLLFRYKSGLLPVEIPAIVSNHTDFYQLAASYNIPFHHLPLEAGASEAAKLAQEARVMELVDHHSIDLVVLARYMQILSDEMSAKLSGRCINIHHSFLPGFRGARPYHQAHERGVKLIGATAHYVTSALDEGPIIDQDVERISHRDTPDDLVRKGRDIERRVLARAMRYHLEDRVILNGRKTVVFMD
jgi:formyltetrahydrofolate deformylase